MLRVRAEAYVDTAGAAQKRSERSDETLEQRTERQKKDADRKRLKRAAMTVEDKAAANEKHAKRQKQYRKEGYRGPAVTGETVQLTSAWTEGASNFNAQL